MVVAAASWQAPAAAVGTRRFELSKGEDFKGGDLKGVAIDGAGRVHAGLNFGSTPLNDVASVWAALERPDGSVLLATGNEGKLLEARGDSVREVAASQTLVLTSLIEAFGRVLVGSMPGGQVLELKGGQLTPFAKLGEGEHVWQLAFDARAGVVYAATGPEGRLYRIDAQGRATVHFDAEEQHLMSVLVSARHPGWVFAGASDKAKLYAIGPSNKATVVHDFGTTEVRALAESPAGDLFAIANEVKPGSHTPTKGKDGDTGSTSGGKGVLYRFDAEGTPEEMLASKTEHFVSLTIGSDGRPYVGTGVDGEIYTTDDAHHDVLMADTEERQVSVMLFNGKRPLLLSSDPAVLHPIKGLGGADSVWTSRPLDAGIKAHFGRLDWVASGALSLSTRSGNTSQPDSTWSDWSPELSGPGRSLSPPGRYVQIRARWGKDALAALSGVTLHFVTDNLRARITKVDVESAAEEGDAEKEPVTSSGGPPTQKAASTLKLRWEVDNPDQDTLRYRLFYRLVGSPQWLEMLPPRRKLTKANYDWDTTDLPEGHYRVRVEGSDELANPPDKVKRHSAESGLLIVDNTPPNVDLRAQGRVLRGSATDGVGPVARIEVSVAGSAEWFPFYPSDGIFDEQREDFELDLSRVLPAGRQLIALRVYDQAHNFVVRQATIE